MIDIIQTPQLNSVFLNTAPINIIVNSLLGEGYYFNMQIYVNDEFYTEHVRAKIDNYTCEIDFNGAVAHIFNQTYTAPTANGIVENTELLKKVTVTILEIEESTGIEVNSITLPNFYLIQAQQENNNIYNSLQFLSIYQDHVKMPTNGVLSLPFLALNTTTAKLYINSVLTETLTVTDAFGVYNANFILETYSLTENDVVSIEIADSNTTLTKTLVIYSTLVYAVNQLIIQNNYNAWEHFYCFGEKENSTEITRKTIAVDQKRISNYKNISKPLHKINTGNYHQDYSSTITNVINAQLLYLYVDNELTEVTLTNKKTTPSKTRLYYYSTALSLENNHEPNHQNTVQYITPPSLSNITVTGIENVNTEITKAEFLEKYNGTDPLYISFPISTTTATISVVVGSNTTVVNTETSYLWADFEKVMISGNGFGTPYDTFKYNIENTVSKSNTATATVNVIMYDPLNRAPVISVASEEEVYVDASSKSIVATIVEPDGDDYTVVWQQISGNGITTSSLTSETLTLSEWPSTGAYEFLITATDNRGNSSTATTILNVKDYVLEVGGNDESLIIKGGQSGSSVKLKLRFASYIYPSHTIPYPEKASERFFYSYRRSIAINNIEILKGYSSYVNYYEFGGVVNEKIEEINETEIDIDLVFPSTGEIVFPIIKTQDNSTQTESKMDIRLLSGVKATLYSPEGLNQLGINSSDSFSIYYD